MNSIFSSFDAVCAEILGQSVRASLKPSSWCKCDGGVKSHQPSREITTTENNSGNSSTTEGKPSPSPAAAACTRRSRQQQQKGAAARFAPELDGLNCFETLVSF
ncbi:hypothetical protein RHGRI_006134 [Rhododendron griersonianum]|uniref:Uncharacterized protein n=1 Tax=Rhododendron griersonianum TaxID=479676 RepID=A0AAV6LEP6_9ERIC|nr:hypothetical protein RHGRI_006134 [Rhododendron griersonianum]